MRLKLIALTLMALCIAATAEAAPRFLSVAQMQKAIIGNSLVGKSPGGDPYAEYYDPNGTIVGWSKKDGKYMGQWSFRENDNLMCFKYGEGPTDGGCVHLTKKGKTVGFVRMDATTEPSATWIKGKAREVQ
ncbi:MAG TPA: hypothetical protein VHL08_09640 [Dongiaceae bacterium]|nr:hypothetical protein [Dongiaceae bacterium]